MRAKFDPFLSNTLSQQFCGILGTMFKNAVIENMPSLEPTPREQLPYSFTTNLLYSASLEGQSGGWVDGWGQRTVQARLVVSRPNCVALPKRQW